MHQRPNYETLRQTGTFGWSVGGTYLAYLKLSGVPIRDFFLQPEACIEVYRTGRPRVRELFGPDVGVGAPATPPVSYGHPNGLGAELYFPADGEVAVQHVFRDSLDEAIAGLKRPVDFERAGMAPFYLQFRETLQKAFPDEKVGFTYGLEGPITTAYEVRGDAFFLDPFDQPEKTAEFLRLLTASIVDFHAFSCRVGGRAAMDPKGVGLCDDVAAMIPPHMWERFVLPYWERYFSGMTTGKRSAHVEDLRPAHLKHLETIGLWSYDPSISRHVNPKIITRECRVPFGWRLGSFHYRNMDCGDVRDFVFQAVADGAGSVFSGLEGSMCEAPTVAKVKAFIAAAKEVKALLGKGCPRAEVGTYVSERGRRKFWDTWLR